jgi:hypothetical protein
MVARLDKNVRKMFGMYSIPVLPGYHGIGGSEAIFCGEVLAFET